MRREKMTFRYCRPSGFCVWRREKKKKLVDRKNSTTEKNKKLDPLSDPSSPFPPFLSPAPRSAVAPLSS